MIFDIVSGFCEYKGKKYHKGDTWDDACSYKCECIDEASGAYTCTERSVCVSLRIVEFSNIRVMKAVCNKKFFVMIIQETLLSMRLNFNINYWILQIKFWEITLLGCPWIQAWAFIFRCPRFATLPQSCFMTTDPYDQCCKIPTCPSAPTPGPLGPTPSPTPKGNDTPNMNISYILFPLLFIYMYLFCSAEIW